MPLLRMSKKKNKRLQVAFTHAVTLVVAACAVMNQSRYLQPEV